MPGEICREVVCVCVYMQGGMVHVVEVERSVIVSVYMVGCGMVLRIGWILEQDKLWLRNESLSVLSITPHSIE